MTTSISFPINKVMSDPGGYLTTDEVNRMMSSCRKKHERLIISLLFTTGCRIGELLMITPSDIEIDSSVINMPTEKRTNKQRKEIRKALLESKNWAALHEDKVRWARANMRPVYIPPDIMQILVEYIRENDMGLDDRIFPYTTVWAWQVIRRVGEKAGIYKVGKKKIHPHNLRHTFAMSSLKEDKTSEALVYLKSQMGHSSIKVTEGYLNPSKSDIINKSKQVMGKIWRRMRSGDSGTT